GRLRVQEFEHGDDPDKVVWAVWSPTGEGRRFRHELTAVPGKLLAAERMPLGEELPLSGAATQRSDGAVDVEVTESPVYLVFQRNPSMTLSSPSISSAARPLRAHELNAWLRALHPVPEPSVDRVIAGDPQEEVKGIAVMWTPTWAALREALTQGCNVLVAHEPTFFSHLDLDAFEGEKSELSKAGVKAMSATRDAKLKWIQDNGMVVIRCHDVLDLIPGGVADSLARRLGFSEADVLVNQPYYRVVKVVPAMRAIDLAQRMAQVFGTIGQPGVAFYGDPERKVEKLGIGTGYACEPWTFVELGADMCVTIDDRIKTWIETEWADDAGYPMIVIHHGTSEEWGVHTLHGTLAKAFPDLPVKLIAQGFRARWVSP
ncbi:MAG TPA: Nif3-like dinuclear metal center hexameric protein, partial [Opitutus sp.]|nr:Nif3-like dinuclear metal center hexameric protein [Opitutus sp.]